MDDIKTFVNTIRDFYNNFYENVSVESFHNAYGEDIITVDYQNMPGGLRLYRVYINNTHNTIVKYRIRADEYVLFDMGELEFFDKLGFNLNLNYQKATKQDISDWWE